MLTAAGARPTDGPPAGPRLPGFQLGDPGDPADALWELGLTMEDGDTETVDEDEEEVEEEEGSGGHVNEQERALRHQVKQYDRAYAYGVHTVKRLGQVGWSA